MATYYARKAGNINASDVWATTPSGTAAAVTFVAGDVLVANSFAIAVNVDTNLGASGQVRNDTTGGATNGGGFTLASGVTLTANVYGNANGTSANCVVFNSTTPSTATIVAGTIAAGSNNSAVENANTGTLTITVSGTVGNGNGSNGNGVRNSSTGTIYLTASGGIFGGSAGTTYGVLNQGAGNVFITGNVTGGTNNVTPHGVHNNGGGTVEITGTATGGSNTGIGANNSNGTLRVTKAVGNGFGPGTTGLTATVGVASNLGGGGGANSITTVEQIEFGALGQSPTSGAVRLVANGTNNANFYTTTGGRKTLIDATANAAMPAASDVRSGLSYAAGALTGTCAVPAAGSVALGVPVDATTGTAVLTVANVQSALTAQGLTSARAGNLDNLDTTISSRLAPSGTLATVTNLTNAPASVTASDIWTYAARTLTSASGPTAVQIRQEIDANSTKLDAAISSRLAASAYTAPTAAPTVTAIRQEMDSNSTKLANLDATVSSRLASASYQAPSTPPSAATIASAVWAAADKTGYSLTSAERSAIAAAAESSLLNESDGQQILNAIVGAIGNQNIDQVAIVAAVRADLERTGGKLDSIPTTSAPSASTVAGAVWSHTTRTLTSGGAPSAVQIRQEMDANSTKLANLDAPVSGATAPSAATVASAVRAELTEISRLDVAVSSRMAGSEATKLDAVKSKTDLLNTDRLSQVATTSIVGSLISQANS